MPWSSLHGRGLLKNEHHLFESLGDGGMGDVRGSLRGGGVMRTHTESHWGVLGPILCRPGLCHR